jgi:hypothetical protein
LDYGAKRNILRCLASAGCDVTVMPATTTAEDVLAQKPDGVFLSNGPGDPAATGDYAVPMIQGARRRPAGLRHLPRPPDAGAGAGAKTVKMNHGHHGANHPVKDLETGKVEITSMNHGFTVDSQTLPEGVIETHVTDRLFDGSNCGIRMNVRPPGLFGADTTREASPGPQDSFYLFERFLPLGRILLEPTLLNALARVHGAPILTLGDAPPDPRLANAIPRDVALRAEAVPCHDADGTISIATARPDLFDLVNEGATTDTPPKLALATRADILDAQTKLWGAALAREAETRAPVALSCRTWRPDRVLAGVLALTAILLILEALFPAQVVLVAFGIAGLAFTANITLKGAAFLAMLLHPGAAQNPPSRRPDIAPHLLRPPVVSLLVPMFREPEIAERLVTHLARMRYPPERLDILLLLEEDDTPARPARSRPRTCPPTCGSSRCPRAIHAPSRGR